MTQSGPWRILLVEDDPDLARVLSLFLEHGGHTVTWRQNGREGLVHLEAHVAEVDLVLMDIMMPELDGNEAIARIRADERLKHLPVIAVSALNRDERPQPGTARPFDGYLPKPFTPEALFEAIDAATAVERLSGD